jgi:hypothetical protein
MMKPKYVLICVPLLLALPARAESAQNLSSAQQMADIRACAARQGVNLPPEPGTQGDSANTAHLSDDQKKIVDGCFKASGLKPPARHDDPVDNGEGSMPPDHLGPPPEADFR